MIKELTLQNFKAFENFNEPMSALNLITGLNGLGKSTIIQSLLLLRQSHFMQKLKNKGLFLNGEYVKIGKGVDAYWIHGIEEIISFKIKWDDESLLSLRFNYVTDEDVLPIKDIIEDSNPFEKSLFTNDFQYLHAERIGQQAIYPASEFIVSENKSLGINGEYTTFFLEKNGLKPLYIKDLLHDDILTDTLGAQVNAWLQEISPGVSFIPQSISESEIARQFYEFEYGGEKTRKFRSFNVGFGLNYILPVLTAVLFAKKGDILLIENPEAHIHPRGQSKLGWLFAKAAFNGVQLFIETHSDHVLNGIRVAVKKLRLDPDIVNILYFNRDISAKSHSTLVTRPCLDSNGRLDKWPDGFLDEWDNMLDELI